MQMHHFVDKTYFNPTHCKFCGGLLVGLVIFKQGLQCKLCKYDCHKNCSKFVPHDCRVTNKINQETININDDVIFRKFLSVFFKAFCC